MEGTLVVNGCPSHGEGRTGPSLGPRELGWDGVFDEVGLGAGVQAVYSTRVCIDRHSVVAHMSGLPLRGGSQRFVVWQELPRL